ncbi:protein trichome berefringence-like 7 [Selaginella moellendorffii]|uniref:protein trichome berefringence-like 7 n=1 Tax=Selaginella moellendorffii TaxID=88036 RepID=UPI000D1CA6F7|nr:protein trichome berefringence-like 7 [Selaginella moellendorffii]|eukprot:XP_024520544.1 protein trichome berefringence-like 7 [Selaginella moellendorffii]
MGSSGPLLLLLPLLACALVLSYTQEWQQQQQQQPLDVAPPPQCDISAGSWVYDRSYPLYRASDCPLVEQGFRCQDNGRPDSSYTKWRWKPSQCHIPSFNAARMLQLLRGRRIAFVGDSMGRTQWESLVCMLLTAVADKSSVWEVNNRTITKREPYLAFHFAMHKVTVEYHRSPFLVQESPPPKHAPRRVRSILRLDQLEASRTRWADADVLVFNSGHWWNPSKTRQVGCYFYVGNTLRLGMKLEAAYQAALNTWARWVDSLVDTNKTRVLFRSLEPSHWDWPRKRCSFQRQPNASSLAAPSSIPQLALNRILHRVVQGMNKSVEVLNITTLSHSRSDAHVGRWSPGQPPLDCSHWCLPGVPDTWNQLLYATLLSNKNNRVATSSN